jgi:hypothetical protein
MNEFNTNGAKIYFFTYSSGILVHTPQESCGKIGYPDNVIFEGCETLQECYNRITELDLNYSHIEDYTNGN